MRAVEFIPADYFQKLALPAIFPRAGRLEVDAGCGRGSFLAGAAAKWPERNFLGLERVWDRVSAACGRVSRNGLNNVQVLRIECAYAIRCLLPPESVTVLHVSFPDPWPKRRHAHHRLLGRAFFHDVIEVLAPDGELRVTTDDQSYLAQIAADAGALTRLACERWEPGEDYPETDFERRFRAARVPIYRLRLTKV